MAGNGTPNSQFLAPPAVTALRQEARSIDPKFPPMSRSISENMREEREDLKEAAEQTLNVIVDLDLDGRIKWVSPSWKQVVGTAPESVEGRMIADFLLGNKDVFQDAIESLKVDDSRSRFIRFAVPMGPDSLLRYTPESRPLEEGQTGASEGGEVPEKTEEEYPHGILDMEAQGIMVFDRTTDGSSHVGHVGAILQSFYAQDNLQHWL